MVEAGIDEGPTASTIFDHLRPSSTVYQRYVAIGDSSTEGLDDPDGRGGFRGWANRLAEHLARAEGSILYANLAVRGRRTRDILDQQLAPALAMRPDLVTVFSGTNDVVARRFRPESVAEDMTRMQSDIRASGAVVVTFTLPDLTPVMPLAGLIAARVRRLNDAVRTAALRSGALLVDVAAYPVASDPRLWSGDRLHANALGHERIAAALAHAIALPGTDDTWSLPLPEPPAAGARQRLAQEMAWGRAHLFPWVWRHLRGRSSGDGRGPKRPELQVMLAS